ncbi:hypothetical protein HC028_12070 [Planosporangium flavigriseum]|uniref:Uncharacterized protein n=1 Tax=Planosporangium flavigriseum TaxID=373681 RepID=A0A8J3PJI2_9ACTN|nr:hypothetical protein [Planosporangium flavigriseum]NJC65233.1 hypothetical protein [Planosporangium flavigriseum]GIG71852.1 hypothetical protein Pfl04_02560 [Planosporangium flavigriseum]
MSEPDKTPAPDTAAAAKPKQRDRLGRFLYWIFGPPTANNAISAHSPQAKAYRERQRALRQQEREARKKRDESQ